MTPTRSPGEISGAPDTIPLVSVVICFYNAAPYLETAIESVRSQTHPRWELLLVDDGSTDAGTDIALGHAARDPERVRYLEHTGHANRGFAASRNVGCRAARGKYLASLDADDVFMSASVLAEQVALLEAHPEAASVYGPVQYWFSWGSRPAEDVRQDLTVSTDTVVPPPTILTRFLERIEDQPVKELVRRDVYVAVGGFDERLVQFEDAAFSAKVCLHYPVYVSSRCWYRYRQRPDSSWQTERARGRAERHYHDFVAWLHGYLAAQEWDDAALARVLRRRRRPLLWRRVCALVTERIPAGLGACWGAVRAHARFHLHGIRVRCGTVRNGLGVGPRGTIDVDSHSLLRHPWSAHRASVVLEWRVAGVQSVELRAHRPDGPTVAGGEAGRVPTGYWLRNPTLFYLQDTGHPAPGTVNATVAILRVGWTSQGRVVRRLIAGTRRPS